MRLWLLTAIAIGCAAPRVLAQDPPQACGQDARRAEYGSIDAGAIVVPQRHRFVGGDPNWDPRMGRFLGRVARVTRRSGVDAEGCPGVRLDVDGGEFFWRVRDLNVGAEQPPAPGARHEAIPEACGSPPRYGPVRVGTRVVLGRHRPVDGDDNWIASMRAYVGRAATVLRIAGGDDQGCPGVLVDADGGEWFWRIRDMRLAGEGDAPVTGGGFAAEHGRSGGAQDDTVPQACGLTDQSADYGPVQVGSEVVLGRHRAVDGEPNWVPDMDAYVGRRARVTQLIGVDDQGCPLVAVDADGGDWYWRVRDLTLP